MLSCPALPRAPKGSADLGEESRVQQAQLGQREAEGGMSGKATAAALRAPRLRHPSVVQPQWGNNSAEGATKHTHGGTGEPHCRGSDIGRPLGANRAKCRAGGAPCTPLRGQSRHGGAPCVLRGRRDSTHAGGAGRALRRMRPQPLLLPPKRMPHGPPTPPWPGARARGRPHARISQQQGAAGGKDLPRGARSLVQEGGGSGPGRTRAVGPRRRRARVI